ncbi:relaxase, partial [Cronobacter sakazakii]
APAPAPAKDVATTDIPRESISEKIAELELRLREDRRKEIVEKILQKNAAQQQKHLLFLRWLASLKQFIELLRSYGKSILHKPIPGFSKLYAPRPLHQGRKIHL